MDVYTKRGKTYSEIFKKKYTGEIFTQKDGGDVVVIDYSDFKNVKVRFLDDGTEVIDTIDRIRKGYVKKSKKLFKDAYIDSIIGREFINESSGKKYKIIGGENSRKIKVEFEDGTVVNNCVCDDVFAGRVIYPGERSIKRMINDASKRIGEVYHSSIGMSFEIVGFNIVDNKVMYKVRFDDMTELDVYDGGQFKKQELPHPNISGKAKTLNIEFKSFMVFNREFSEGSRGNKYYSCKCSKCDKEGILTFDEMVQHTCKN